MPTNVVAHFIFCICELPTSQRRVAYSVHGLTIYA